MDSNLDSSRVPFTPSEIERLAEQFLMGSNLSELLTSSQISQLNHLSTQQQRIGIECLLTSWLMKKPEGNYCRPAWDNIYCWPPTPPGTITVRTCEQAFSKTEPFYAPKINGNAFRVCSENGTWLWGNWTNYTECADSFEALMREIQDEKKLVVFTQNVVCFGSILSLCFLLSAVFIFSYFKCLRCDRVAVHVHLMTALILRYILLFIITEPFVLHRETNYRSVDFICKMVVSIYLFSTMTSINWMFIEGIYINGKLTTSVFDRAAPFKLYYVIGWVFPFVAVGIYVCVMEQRHPVKCWKGYSEMGELWIILGPMLVALLANFLFLINILRVLLQTVQNRGGVRASETAQFRRAAKATAFLIPLLGVNNLLFVYNPGGGFHKYYVMLNALFGSTQGIFVSIVYCYMSNDVRDTFRRIYGRYMSRQSTRTRTPLRVVWSRRPEMTTHWDSLATTEDTHIQPSGRNPEERNSFIRSSPTTMRNEIGEEAGDEGLTLSQDSFLVVGGRNGRISCNLQFAETVEAAL